MKTFYKKFLTLVVWLICLGVMSNTVMAQDEVEAYQRSRNEYVFTVQISDRAELQTLTRMASIEKVLGNEVYCFANQKEYDALKKAGYELKLIDNRPGRYTYPMWDAMGAYNYDCYLEYEDYVYFMQSYAANHTNCTLINLGATPGGHEILGVRISPDDSYECPRVLVTGAIHGNEMLSTVASMKLIDKLLTDNSNDVLELVNNLDIFILPSLNPDGTYPTVNYSVDDATRGNANGVDLNRNFPDNIEGLHPDGNVYQYETQLLMDFFNDYNFTLAVNYHTGGAVVNYPWDNSTTNHADRRWWEYVCAQYVATARNMGHSLFGNNKTYMRSASNVGDTQAGYVRGCDWYVVYGGAQDYMNYYKGCRSVTIEIFQDGEVENPIGNGSVTIYSPTSASSIAKYVQANIPAAMQLMKEALYGIQGKVMDTDNVGIEGATITVNNHDVNGSEVMSNYRGKYFRPIKAGTYSVTYSAPGYVSQTVNVTATDGHATTQNVYLQADNQVINVDFSADADEIMVGGTVHFTNASAGVGELSYSWTFEGGSPATSTAENPIVQYAEAGTYDVTLTVTNNYGASETLTKANYIEVSNSVKMCNGFSVVTNDPISFYDSGGANGNYSNNEEYVYTFYPYSTEHNTLTVTFQSFETQRNNDKLFVYNGPTTSSPQIGEYYHGSNGQTNSNVPTEFEVTGPVTFKFTSNSYLTAAGWAATVVCVPEPVYTVNYTAQYDGGTIAVDPCQAYVGETINVTAHPASGYQLVELYYTNASNQRTDINLNTMSFVMPASNVTLTAVFSDLPTHVDFNMCNATVVAGNVSFYDHGGGNFNYDNNENYTCVFTPFQIGGFVQIVFNSFYTESRYDKLVVYDGNNTNAPVIGSFSGNAIPATVVASNPNGALTCCFTSDYSVNRTGWSALVTTVVYDYFDVNVATVDYGTLAADKELALAGDVITLTAAVDPSYADDHFFAGWNVTCGDQQIEVVNNQFVMPEGDVVVSGRFAHGFYTPTYYELVNSTIELQAGETYVITDGQSGTVHAMGAQSSTLQSGYNFVYFRTAVSATATDGIIQATPGMAEFVLYDGPITWSFYDPEEKGYVYCKRSKINNTYYYSLSTATSSNYKDFEIGITNGVGYIENVNYYRDIAFDGSSRFTFFSVGNGHDLCLFKKVEGFWTEAPAKDILGVNANGEVAAIVYPNPTTGIVSLQAEGMQQISVFNVMGQEVMSLSANSDMETLDLGGLDAGMYIIRICTENGIAVKRVNLMH